jgi:hypothetical protein
MLSRGCERVPAQPDTPAADEDQASASARSALASLPHLWKGSSAAVAIEFHAEGSRASDRSVSPMEQPTAGHAGRLLWSHRAERAALRVGVPNRRGSAELHAGFALQLHDRRLGALGIADPVARASRSCAISETTCWTPSWRSRSGRRRSESASARCARETRPARRPAGRSRRRDRRARGDARVADPERGLARERGQQLAVLLGQRCLALVPALDGADALGAPHQRDRGDRLGVRVERDRGRTGRLRADRLTGRQPQQHARRPLQGKTLAERLGDRRGGLGRVERLREAAAEARQNPRTVCVGSERAAGPAPSAALDSFQRAS